MTAAKAQRPASAVEAAAREWVDGAIVTVRWPNGPDDRRMERLAVFAFALPRGRFVWVESTYVDPYGWPSPSSHEVRRLREVVPVLSVGPAFEGENEAGWIATFEPYRRGLREDFDPALDWFHGYLRRRERTWAQEREHVRRSFK